MNTINISGVARNAVPENYSAKFHLHVHKKILLCILPMPLILFIINAVEAGRTCHIEGVAAFMNAKQSGKLMAKKML